MKSILLIICSVFLQLIFAHGQCKYYCEDLLAGIDPCGGDINTNQKGQFIIYSNDYEFDITWLKLREEPMIFEFIDFQFTLYGPFDVCGNISTCEEDIGSNAIAYTEQIHLEQADVINDQLNIASVGQMTDYQLMPGRYVWNLKILNKIWDCSYFLPTTNYSDEEWHFGQFIETNNLHCPGSNTGLSINHYELCDAYYSICGQSTNEMSFTLPNGPNEVWLGTVITAASNFSLIYNTNDQLESCLLNQPFQVDVFGPFGECINPCTAIVNNAPTTVISSNGAALISLNTQNAAPSFYLFRLSLGETTCGPCQQIFNYSISNAVCQWPSESAIIENECEDCLPGTVLEPEKKYVVGGWVKQDDHMPWVQVMERPVIELWGVGTNGLTQLAAVSAEQGDPIVEGWQLIETEFEVPQGITEFEIRLKSLGGISYFDDIRLFPANGSMKCYVYDPVSLRFVSELDERHFATFYEYDEEGRLMRIKKETERGIMTIQESKSSTVKR
jgi:hypothetical protein